MSALKRLAASTSAAGGTVIAVEAARYASLENSDYHTLKSSVYQFVCYDVLRIVGVIARRSHDSDCDAFEARQRELLQQQLKANEGTAYGRDYGFAGLLGENDFVDAFRRAHPTTRYEHFAPYVDRVANGEASVLNAEPETLLAATSGTSGKRALLPSTPTMSSTFFKRGILVVFDTMRRAEVDCFELQKTCKLTFAASWQTSSGGLRVGPNSSGPKDKGFEKLLPLYSTPMAGYQIEGDETAALYVHALFAARDQKLGILEANFVSLPFRLLNLVSNEGAQLATDLENGCLHAAIADRLPEPTVKAINDALGGANPKRAAELRAALSNDDKGGASADPNVGLAKRIWPKLRLILANATGAFDVYAQRLQAGIGQGTPILSTILAASEGLMGVALTPSTDGQSSFCLVPRAMFFEFQPLDENSVESRKESNAEQLVGGTLLGHQLAVGQDYELVITNLGGLYRYRLGDVVRVTGFHGKAPLVEFRYRQGQLLNLRGEKLPEPALATAVSAALPKGVGEYTAMEVIDASPPHYRVFVEAEKGPRDQQLGGCHNGLAAQRLDDALKQENPVYATWRQKGAIGAPEVQEVRSGTFEQLRAQRLADGVAAQQLKVSRVLRTEKQIALLMENAVGESSASSKSSPSWFSRFFSK